MFNNSDRQPIELLAGKAAELPEPLSYYRGGLFTTVDPPSNVLVFSRRRWSKLQESREPHYHHRFVLICAAAGGGSVILDGRRVQLQAGRAVLVFPHQYHHYAGRGDFPIRWIYVTFESLSHSSLEPLRNRAVDLGDRELRYLTELVGSYGNVSDRDEHRPDAVVLHTALLLSALKAALARQDRDGSLHGGLHGGGREGGAQSSAAVVDRANRYIHQHIDRPISVSEVADACALSQSHLRRLYRAEMGIGIGAYIRRVRLNRALSLLGSSSMNISQIADACGYESLYSFSRAFKRELGVSPSGYREGLELPRS